MKNKQSKTKSVAAVASSAWLGGKEVSTFKMCDLRALFEPNEKIDEGRKINLPGLPLVLRYKIVNPLHLSLERAAVCSPSNFAFASKIVNHVTLGKSKLYKSVSGILHRLNNLLFVWIIHKPRNCPPNELRHSRWKQAWPAMVMFKFHKPLDCPARRLLPAG